MRTLAAGRHGGVTTVATGITRAWSTEGPYGAEFATYSWAAGVTTQHVVVNLNARREHPGGRPAPTRRDPGKMPREHARRNPASRDPAAFSSPPRKTRKARKQRPCPLRESARTAFPLLSVFSLSSFCRSRRLRWLLPGSGACIYRLPRSRFRRDERGHGSLGMSREYVVYGQTGTGSVIVEAALTLLGLPYRVVEKILRATIRRWRRPTRCARCRRCCCRTAS